MGFFDCKCMLTGVSIDFVGTMAVVLRHAPTGYEPVSLGLSGEYDGAGHLDGLRADPGTELLYDFLQGCLHSGRFVTTYGYNESDLDDSYRLDAMFGLIENYWMEDGYQQPTAVLDGAPLVYATIAQPIWDAIATTAASGPATLHTVFGDNPIQHEIYGAHAVEVDAQLQELARIADFVSARGLRWAQPFDPEQRYPTDGEQRGDDQNAAYVAQARLDYSDSPALLAGLDDYVARLAAVGLT
ncbi:hypothetical protein [Mycolicibacterium mucogenicum]|uniref:Uncharacterized protein n=1 Tax=Mycolicibacterium mucogenicum DSM 44124 TaxID=1226753 RepID=A0A8H2JB12_MYCMU|nr:hypothetical protein [Mycolicibacterium mucogenicum]KAB7756162.1 hypothetical protein MMUC44124_17325 [Mycolicibacterium mucogenicum DSM 44124]QPG70642.1 hypothetical protein C1S78_006640 [Mycolicibacterium mucogenicum DSM 44124]